MNALLDSLKGLSPAQRKALIAVLAKKGIDLHAQLPIPTLDREQALALSFAQQRLWFLWQLDPDGSAYNIPGALRIQGPLDTALVQRTFDYLVARHEALRTTFDHRDEADVQVIHPHLQVPMALVDLSHLALDDAERQAAGLAEREALAPFDLRHGPLLRLQLVRFNDNDHLLLVTLHHIIADGWSVDVFLKEFARVYDAFNAEAEPALAALPIQYADYAHWQREWLDAGESDRQLAYWRQQLGDQHPLLQLPLDHPRPAQLSARGGSVDIALDADLSNRLKTLAKAEDVTLFVILLAAFNLLLYRYSGQHDLRIGVPVANRNRLETEGVVGFFVNTLVLRTQIDSRQTFRQLLQQVHQASVASQANQDLPFERLVEALQPERSLSHNPLFQVKFNYGFDVSSLPAPQGLSMTRWPSQHLGAHFDLALDLTDTAQGVQGAFTYARDLFEVGSIESLACEFVALLGDLVRQPGEPLWAMAEHRPSDEGLVGPALTPDYSHVLQAWDAQCQQRAQAVAVKCSEQTLNFAELDAQANRLAHYLQTQGVDADEPVLIALPRSSRWVMALLGVLKSGAAYVPLDPQLPAARLAQVAGQSAARWLLVDTDAVADVPGVQRIDLRSDTWRQAGEHPAVGVRHPQQAAYAIFTSGSTGQPKGVRVSHRALNNYVQALLQRTALAPEASMAMVSSVAADLGHTVLFGALCSGRTLHLLDDRQCADAEAFAEYMSRERVGVLKIVPSHLRGLLQATDNPAILPWHALISGGEACDWELVAQIRRLAPGCRLINHYGPSETTVGVLVGEVGERQTDSATALLGLPLANCRAKVLDDDLNAVPVNAIGELYIGGAGLADGYLGQPGLTAERFIADPGGNGQRLYRTGDRVRNRRDGLLEFLGRSDDQVKIRGYRVELNDITQALKGVAGVLDAVVLACPGSTGSLQLVAWCVLADDTRLASVQQALQAQLPDYQQPALWQQLEAMPLTANGKLDRRALPAPEQAQAQFVEPRNPVETSMAEVWANVLKLPRVGVTDNFFELGGDSILSLQIIARSRKLGFKLSPKQLFEKQTIEQLALLFSQPTAAPVVSIAAHTGDRQQGPLSLGQQRLWFLWKMAPTSSAYNIAAALRLRGPLDRQALHGAFAHLVARHEGLRTTFREVEGQPRQFIGEPQVPQLDVDTLSDPQALQQRLQAYAAQPFDLASGPLLRLNLLACGEQEHVLSIVIHHIVADGWTMNLLTEEFSHCYARLSQGQAPQLPALALQYQDFVAWQRDTLGSDEVQRQLRYWQDTLAGEQPVLQLPCDHPRPAQQSYRGAQHRVHLAPAMVEGLRSLAQARGDSLFMLLLAAFELLLFRCTGQHDLRIGVPVANRNRVELEGVLGFFVNTQVLRGQLQGEQSFEQLLAQVKTSVLAAQEHQDLSFEQLVEALNPQRSLSHNPLFQAMYNHTRLRSQALQGIEGLDVEVLEPHSQTTQFDLMLHSEERADGGLRLTFGYACDLFEAASIERLAGHFVELLNQVLSRPSQALDDFQLADPAQRERLLALACGPQREAPQPLYVHHAIAAQARRSPDATALLMGEQRMSYGELERRANQLARRLVRLGAGPEVVVGIAAQRSLEMVVGLLAILKAGAAYLPLDPDYPAQRLAYMVADSGIRLLLAQPALLADLPLPDGVQVLDLGQPCDDEAVDAPAPAMAPEQLAYVIYTSGSTGQPKGAGNSHAALANRLAWMQAAYRLGVDDCVLQKTPFGFDVSVWEFFWPLMTGARLALAGPGEHQDPECLARRIRQYDVTTLHFVPSMLQAFMAQAQLPALPSLTRIVCSGEALAAGLQDQVLARLPQAQLYNLYGPTEAAIDVSHWTCRSDGRDSVPIGRPIDNTQLYVLDARLQPQPLNVIGELYIGGDNLARGYLGRPGLSAERFVANPFGAPGSRLYRTGDLARYRADGAIEYAGRCDHQVKLRGLRIELGEIEAQLRRCEGVEDAVVLALQGPTGQHLVAYVVTGLDEQGLGQALRSQLREHLPEYMLPSVFVALAQLPLSANGKLERRALPTPQWHSEARYQAPETPVQRQLADIWQTLLKVERVGLDDDFFALGGHSLLATRMAADIRQALLIELPLRCVFEAGSLAALAQRVEQELAAADLGGELDSMAALLAELEQNP